MTLTADSFGDMRGMVMKLMTDGFGGTGDGVCRRGLLTGIFTAAYVAAFLGQAWLNARLARAEERRSYQRLALFLWLYVALCGPGLAVKILV